MGAGFVTTVGSKKPWEVEEQKEEGGRGGVGVGVGGLHGEKKLTPPKERRTEEALDTLRSTANKRETPDTRPPSVQGALHQNSTHTFVLPGQRHLISGRLPALLTQSQWPHEGARLAVEQSLSLMTQCSLKYTNVMLRSKLGNGNISEWRQLQCSEDDIFANRTSVSGPMLQLAVNCCTKKHENQYWKNGLASRQLLHAQSYMASSQKSAN